MTQLTNDRDLAAVRLDQPRNHGQADPRSPCSGSLAPEEALEYMRQVLWYYARAVVAYLEGVERRFR